MQVSKRIFSGEDISKTEGVGEMAEAQTRRLYRHGKIRFPVSRPRRRSLSVRPRSLHLRPADAPCRAPEPARLGRSSIRPRLWPARVTRSPTHAMPKTDRVEDYFFFRRFVFFFATAFFLFFAIAALLAMSGWRCKSSAVANRSALQPDYYSRKKLIETPLHFVHGCRACHHCAHSPTTARATPRQKIFTARDLPREFRGSA